MSTVSVIRYQVRDMTCGSCRAHATKAVLVNGTIHATTCQRHMDLWIKRANAWEASK